MDITMCNVIYCDFKKKCYRHAESGTKPNEYRQSYFVFPNDYFVRKEEDCKFYTPIQEVTK